MLGRAAEVLAEGPRRSGEWGVRRDGAGVGVRRGQELVLVAGEAVVVWCWLRGGLDPYL